MHPFPSAGSKRHFAFALLSLGLVLLLHGAGCQQATAPAPGDSAPAPATRLDEGKSRPAEALPSPRPELLPEPRPTQSPPGKEQHWWFVTQVQGHPVGYVHVRRSTEKQAERTLMRWEAEHRLRLQRFGQQTETTLSYWSLEEPSGQVMAFGTQVALGGQPQQVQAQRQGEEFLVQLRRGEKTSVRRLAAGEDVRGFFALFQLDPEELTSGKVVRFRQLHPVFLQVVPVELRYEGKEKLTLEGRSHTLHRIKATMQVGPQRLQQLMWLDSQGEVQKTQTTGPGLVEVNLRSTRQQALALWEQGPRWDLGRTTAVRVAKPLPAVQRLEQVRYRLRVPPRAALHVPPLPPWQQVRRTGPGEFEITVRTSHLLRRPPVGPTATAAEAPPPEKYLAPSPLVDSDHPQVAALARSVLPGEKDPWPLAAALQQAVHRRIASKEFSLALASASEALVQGRGDCTEHAVLLAAVARARGIPARLAYGLVYLPGTQSFAFHMWTELWLNRRWVPWDAAWGQQSVGPDHILLGHAELRSPEDWTSLLPLVEVLGQLRLEVLEVVPRAE